MLNRIVPALLQYAAMGERYSEGLFGCGTYHLW